MNKFKQARRKKKADEVQAELFADTMDMVARERAVLKLYKGKQSLAVHNLPHAVNLINKQLGHEYDNMMSMTSKEMNILYDGINTLIHGWQHSNEIDTELSKALHNPQNYSNYQDYIKHLLRLSSLETTIKILGNFKK